MDPVAQQFVAQLDAATEELPRSVQAGLAMCGDDVVPALVERVADAARPVPTRAFSAHVLAGMKAAEGWPAMASVVAAGDVVMLPLLGRLLVGGGAAAAEASMRHAEDASLPAEVRLVLAGLAVRAGGVAWATPRASRVAIGAYAEAPGPSLSLMRMVPSAEYRAVLERDPELLRANAEAAMEILLASEPEGQGRLVAEALAKGLDGFLNDVVPQVQDRLQAASVTASADPRDDL